MVPQIAHVRRRRHDAPDAWTLELAMSSGAHFDYAPGQSTATFTNRRFPARAVFTGTLRRHRQTLDAIVGEGRLRAAVDVFDREPVLEYACHEGNEGMRGMLKAERLKEKEEAGSK